MPEAKKKCPICKGTETVKENEVTVCASCGHKFRPTDK